MHGREIIKGLLLLLAKWKCESIFQMSLFISQVSAALGLHQRSLFFPIINADSQPVGMQRPVAVKYLTLRGQLHDHLQDSGNIKERCARGHRKASDWEVVLPNSLY